MLSDEFSRKAIRNLVNAQNILEHSAALVYAKDSESINLHLNWLKWYLERLQESLDVLSDVGF